MNYEKEYKKLKADIEKAYLFAQTDSTKAALEHILPELRESEDERIRKVLIDLVKCNERSGYTLLNNVTTDSMLAWLEKQGENHIEENLEMVKPAWSEEDETNLRLTEYAVMKFFGGNCSLMGWLRKSLKERIGG